jgi:capsular exopolysaccharide synthesis family protein
MQKNDGKTALATNLAISLAQLGRGDVLLIDADMRNPDVHHVFGVDDSPGLSAFLTGQVELPAVLTRTRVPGLCVVPAGRVPLNPAELVASDRLGEALEALGGRFAHIVLDAPPIFGATDPLILASRVEGVILVLRHGRASREGAQRAIQLLSRVRARVLGVVLNDVDARSSRGALSGYYGFGYYGHGNREDRAAGARI